METLDFLNLIIMQAEMEAKDETDKQIVSLLKQARKDVAILVCIVGQYGDLLKRSCELKLEHEDSKIDKMILDYLNECTGEADKLN